MSEIQEPWNDETTGISQERKAQIASNYKSGRTVENRDTEMVHCHVI
jgi:hypothetical protein